MRLQGQRGIRTGGFGDRGRVDRDVARFRPAARGVDTHARSGIEQAFDRHGRERRARARWCEVGRAGDGGIRTADDRDVVRIQQPLPARTHFQVDARRIQKMSRGFDKAALAARCALRGNVAVGVGGVVAPEDDAAALPFCFCIGADARLRAEPGGSGVLNFRIAAAIVAADPHQAATFFAGGVDPCLIRHGDMMTLYVDRAAGFSRCRELAIAFDEGFLLRLEEDAAAFAHHAAGVQLSAVFHQRADQADAPGISGDLPEIGHLSSLAGDFDLHAGGGGVDELDFLPGGQQGFARRRGDDPFVCHVRGNEIDAAARRRGDGPAIDEAARPRGVLEGEPPGEEVFIADVKRRGNKTSGVDLRPGADEDARRVHEPDTAIGAELSEQLAGGIPQYPIQYAAANGRLDEAHGFACGDAEPLPVENGTGTVLDGQRIACLGERGRPGDDLRADGQG